MHEKDLKDWEMTTEIEKRKDFDESYKTTEEKKRLRWKQKESDDNHKSQMMTTRPQHEKKYMTTRRFELKMTTIKARRPLKQQKKTRIP